MEVFSNTLLRLYGKTKIYESLMNRYTVCIVKKISISIISQVVNYYDWISNEGHDVPISQWMNSHDKRIWTIKTWNSSVKVKV